MSLRHLKKVFESENALPAVIVSSDEEDGILEPVAPKSSKKKKANQKVKNKFELLAEMECVVANEDEEGDGPDEKENVKGTDNLNSDDDESKKKTNQKKQKKRKKRKQNQKEIPSTSTNEGPSCSSNAMGDESGANIIQVDPTTEFELDEDELRELSRRRKLEELLGIDQKSLNPEQELKRMFGSKVIKQEKSSSGNRYHNHMMANYQRRNLLSRRARLVYPKEQRTMHGPTGITLELLNTDDRTGLKTFKFNHSQTYREVQKQFLAAVNTYNPDSIVNLMRSHPYHIDAHIQLSDMAKHSEDMQIASELVEDGINYLQNTFDHTFDICSPTCLLPYKYQENRALHILLFKYLVFLGQRGCPRTALELCKKLLSLDYNNDPLGVTLMIDFYALKSKEFVWLCDLYEYWNPERNLNQLPNWAYSIALAYFLRSQSTFDGKQQNKDGKASKTKTSSASSSSEPDFQAQSNELLQYALLMFPSVLLPLLEKCGVQTDSKVINHWYFMSSISKKQTKSLNLLCDLYVWRTHHLWRDASILRWLEENTQAVIKKIDTSSKVTEDYAQKRQRRYAGSPYNILRHVILTDSKDITIPLPQELSKKPILSFDPITPPDAVDIYNYREEAEPTRPSSTAAANHGLLSMLFRSLVFDLNAMQGQVADGRQIGGPQLAQAARDMEAHQARLQQAANVERGAAGGGENNANAGLAGIQDSVNTLLTAMRDLLQVVNPVGAGAGADENEQNSSESDDDDDDGEAQN